MGTKNNPANRGKVAEKIFNGKVVKPVLFDGTAINQGKYMAIQFEDGDMAEDEDGKPVMWDAV